MYEDLNKPATLQYWSAGHHIRPGDAIDFGTLQDAIAFAMTQRPAGREIAWVRTESGMTLLPSRIAALWEMRRSAA